MDPKQHLYLYFIHCMKCLWLKSPYGAEAETEVVTAATATHVHDMLARESGTYMTSLALVAKYLKMRIILLLAYHLNL
jgi:hypothetical protein